MRKHFLILMLMALLPLAGWAADDLTGKVVVAVADIEYGTSGFASGDIRVTLDGGEISDTYWTTEGLYESINPESGKKDVSALSTLTVGDKRYLKIVFNGAYSGYAYGEFTVSKATVKVDFTGITFENTYKSTAADPTLAESNISVKLGKAEDDVTATKGTYLDLAGLNYSYTGEDADSYSINFTGIALKDDTNYKLVVAEKEFTIKPATITTDAVFAYTLVGGDAYTYNSAEQKSTVTIAWNHDGDAGTPAIDLIEGKDFEVVYNDGANDVDNPTNAATYSIKVNGKGNYTGTCVATSKSFVINKAPLTVMALPQTKVYDGEGYAEVAEYSISGLVGSDLSKQVTGLSVNLSSTAADVNDAITATTSTGSAKIGGTVELNTNYSITSKTSTWKITKRPVTLTIGDAEMNVGASSFPSVPAATANLANPLSSGVGAVNADDQSAIVSAYAVKLQNGVGQKYETALADASSAAVGAYAEAYDATGSEPTNYKVAIVKGKLTVKGKDFDIMPSVASTIQYGNPVNVTLYSEGAEFDPTTVKLNVTGPNDYSASVTYDAEQNATWSGDKPKALGTYTIAFEGTVDGVGANAGATATCLTGVFTIVAKELTITVKDLTALRGDVAQDVLDALDKNAVTITETLPYGEEFEDLNATFKFEDCVTKDAKDKITNGAGDIPNAIDLTIANKNYSAIVTKGQLTVSTNYAMTLKAATAAAQIADAAANGNKYTVDIQGRTLTGGIWNVMVLPFDVKPYDFCQTIGQYAVFNRLNNVVYGTEGAHDTTDKIYFKLEMENLPANEPFIVKPISNVDFAEQTTVAPIESKFKFQDVQFVNPTIDVNGAFEYDGVAGATFTGTYEALMDVNSSNYWVLAADGKWYHQSAPRTGEYGIPFTKAYLELTSGNAARFFVEDIESNGATAIKEISIDTMKSVENDDMYNLNGVKIQGVPAQKGIYIQNGKKVVIK